MDIVYYEGERIYFRPLELEDEPTLRRWINHPQVWATLARCLPMNGVREREWIEKLYKDQDQIVVGIAAKAGDRLIGSCGLHNVDLVSRAAIFGIMIGDLEYQNSGFGTEATALMLRLGFEQLNLNRIALDVLATNARGIKVYERCGFVLEGRQRQRWFRAGRYVDSLHYAVLREDWLRAQQAA
jgi:RimJ/RimL family protein N-acetyltransferase